MFGLRILSVSVWRTKGESLSSSLIIRVGPERELPSGANFSGRIDVFTTGNALASGEAAAYRRSVQSQYRPVVGRGGFAYGNGWCWCFGFEERGWRLKYLLNACPRPERTTRSFLLVVKRCEMEVCRLHGFVLTRAHRMGEGGDLFCAIFRRCATSGDASSPLLAIP